MAARPAKTESFSLDEAQPDSRTSPERLNSLDEALREMLGSCPVPDRLLTLLDRLEAGENPRRKPD
jgi:hypothetical protein